MGGETGESQADFPQCSWQEAITSPVTVTPKSTELAAAAPGTPTAPSALPMTPLARSGSASGYPHAMSGRAAVFINARIVRMRLWPPVLRSSCSSHDRRAAWRASGRSRWRSAATASRRRSRSRADEYPHGDGVWMSWHSAVLTPARWWAVTGVPRLELLVYRQSENGRSTDRSRRLAGIVGQTMGEGGGAPIEIQPAHERHRGWDCDVTDLVGQSPS